MAAGSRVDPFQNFRFRVEIDGIQIAGFSEVTIPDSTTADIEYREGNYSPTSRHLSGLTSSGAVSLKRGITDSLELYKWKKQVETTGAGSARKSLSIILIDETGEDKCRWDILYGWPSKYESGALDAKGNDVLIEMFELKYEGIERVK
jgi:phage tail-like protein